MTVQAGIEIDVDLATIVGEMPAVPCEHPHHTDDPAWHDGEASVYAQGRCATCERVGPLFASCKKFIDRALAGHLVCARCGQVDPGAQVLHILGPVKS